MLKGGKIEFDEQKFIESRPPTMQPFLEQMLQLQIFRQFCEERLAMLNDRRGFSDEFEVEVVRFQVCKEVSKNINYLKLTSVLNRVERPLGHKVLRIKFFEVPPADWLIL